ncbi:MAG: hypothetical protein LUE29_13800 [Lachnospiraceae bacterium]|nr:hypothetical protein [Lachnospiraceae bacterium]
MWEEESTEIPEEDFTWKAWESFYDVVDRDFGDQEAEKIYEALGKRLRCVSFGEYLKRYIYRKVGFTEPFGEIPLDEYRKIILSSFAERNTPGSFYETTAKLSALSKNWLTQQTVRRQVVFLLGFGLGMSEADVNYFLTAVLREQGINPKDPFEVVCSYCIKKGYQYPKFQQLWDEISRNVAGKGERQINEERLKEERLKEERIKKEESDFTVRYRTAFHLIQTEDELRNYLANLRQNNQKFRHSVTARKAFDSLYDETRDVIAALYQKEQESIWQYGAEGKTGNRKEFRREDIGESDLEHVICAAIPVDRHGNLAAAKASELAGQFEGKRLSRQHLRDLRTEKTEVGRFDLITLNFFLFSQKTEYENTPKRRYSAFIESTNAILKECDFMPLYVANPYESFLLMCMLADEPMEIYAEVYELAYKGKLQST